MSVLSKESIRERCQEKPPLIEKCDDNNLQPSSYDISIGNQFYLFDEEKKKKVKEMIHSLEEKEIIMIPPNELCYILSKEKLNMPVDLVAHVSLKTDLIKKGIILAAQPPVDPLYRGKIYAMLYNLSNKEVCISKKETILTLEFMKLDSSYKPDPAQSSHPMQDFDDLKDLIKYPIESSLAETRRDYMNFREKFQRAIPNIITILTIILGILTIFITIVFTSQLTSCGGKNKNKAHIEEKANVQTVIESKKPEDKKK